MRDGPVLRTLDTLRALLPQLLAVLLACALPFVVYTTLTAAASSRAFLVQSVEVDGLARLSEAEILAAADLERPRNVLTIDEDALAAAVIALPWVEYAEVEASLGGVVHIAVTERQLRAVAMAGATWLVDVEGQPIRRWASGDEIGLPVLLGVGDEESGTFVPDAVAMGTALAILEAFELSAAAGARPVREIQRWGLHEYRVRLGAGEDELEVRLTDDRLDERMARLGETLQVLDARGQNADYVILNDESLDRVTVGEDATLRPRGTPTADPSENDENDEVNR